MLGRTKDLPTDQQRTRQATFAQGTDQTVADSLTRRTTCQQSIDSAIDRRHQRSFAQMKPITTSERWRSNGIKPHWHRNQSQRPSSSAARTVTHQRAGAERSLVETGPTAGSVECVRYPMFSQVLIVHLIKNPLPVRNIANAEASMHQSSRASFDGDGP